MIRSVWNIDDIAVSWRPVGRWRDRLTSAAAVIWKGARRLWVPRHATLRMSQEWLEERERQADKLGDSF